MLSNIIKHPSFSLGAAILGSCFLGCSPIFVRMTDLGPLTTGFYRMILALPLLALWTRLENNNSKATPPLSLKAHLQLAAGGLLFAADIAMWNWSLDYTAIVNSTLFNNFAAFFVPIFVWIIYSTRPQPKFMIAVTTGLIGSLLLGIESFKVGMDNLIGDVAAIASGAMVAAYVLAIKRLRDRMGTGTIMFWTGIWSMIGMLALALLSGESFYPLTVYDISGILSLAILVHSGGQGLLAYAMGRIPANYVALIMLLAPVTAALLGWVIYGESLTLLKAVGIALILASIIAVRERERRAE